LFVREDVGRHNAVDKVIGAALLRKMLPRWSRAFPSSSSPSSLTVALARKFKMTLVGFLRGESGNIYAGAERIVS
jgi:FdhD protein